jgi:hypothetical protein
MQRTGESGHDFLIDHRARLPLITTLDRASMASKGQVTRMAGVYLVAAELSRRGFIVSPTSGSAHGTDLLTTDLRARRTYAIEVKTNARTFGFWLDASDSIPPQTTSALS